jgi:hypothetical protein
MKTGKRQILVTTPSKNIPTLCQVQQLKKEDYVLLARKRKLPYTTAALWHLKLDTLKEEINNINGMEFTHLQKQEKKRLSYINYSTSSLKELLQERNLPISGKTRGGNIDAILEVAPPKPFIPDEDQQLAIARRYDKELIINAGPGSGKTSTLCTILSTTYSERPQERLLILVYNKNAEKVLIAKLKCLKCKIIPKGKVYDTKYKGVAVLTFDKFGYQATTAAVKLNQTFSSSSSQYVNKTSYRLSLETAVNNIKYTKCNWNAIFIDEAQDMTETHERVIQEICKANIIEYRLCMAGDPRQELYNGATFFSYKWKNSFSKYKHILHYNHRSSKNIVKALNIYSKANFPSLHHDQIATRDEEGEFLALVEEDNIKKGELIGTCIAECEPNEAYALTPVTLDKFGLALTTAITRQTISDLQPGILVNIFGEYAPHSYDIATSKKMKGTERETVVVYGLDVDYSILIDDTMMKKLIFVALSRAKDNLYIVTSLVTNPRIKNILEALLSSVGIRTLPPVRQNIMLPSFSIEVAGNTGSGLDTGLSTCEGIKVKILSTGITAALHLPTTSGADFVGHYAEALIVQALNLELFTPDNITIIKAAHQEMIGPYRVNNKYIIEVPSSHLIKMHTLLEECKRLNYKGKDGAAFTHATLKYSLAILKLWTVGKDLLQIATTSCQQSNNIVQYIKDNNITPDNTRNIRSNKDFIYSPYSQEPLPLRRRGTNTASFGVISYIPDIMAGYPIEIKHVVKLTNCHRRQASIYACLTRCDKAMLLNSRDGSVEYIAAANYNEVINTAKAVLTLRLARQQVLSTLAEKAIRPNKNLFRGCIIAVDIECESRDIFNSNNNSNDNITEIGAVAFSAIDFTILGVYDKRPACVREMTPEEVDTTVENNSSFNNNWSTVEALTGLVVTDKYKLASQSKALLKDFDLWVNSLSSKRSILHWGGSEKSLFGYLGTCHNLQHEVFRSWLDINNCPRNNMVSLSFAIEQVIPHFRFRAHCAFEDSLATVALYLATTSFEGVV